ncbi:kinase-like domain-containing protein, partial [Abortiporus biennis]
EALLWKNLMHRHVLPFYGIDRTTFKGHLSMVLPWMEHQNIIHTIDIVRRQWGFTKEKFYFQIAQGLAYLHDQGIVHADLRGLNILIDSDYSVRLADFGLAAFASKIGPWDSIRGGNSRWMAPELLIAEREDRDWRPTPESDMYSFGCVIVELFTLEAPFRNSHPLDHQVRYFVTDRNGRPRRPTLFGDQNGPLIQVDLWELAQKCWAQEPSERINSHQALDALTDLCNRV